MSSSRSNKRRLASVLDDDPDENEGQRGSVVRVNLKNFMTYSHVTLNAAPLLNLIIAPNGCGKSALVCGIIIGLAGDVSLTGRSGNLADYVRFGCESGTTDIELKSSSGRNYRIQRKLLITAKPDGGRACRSEWLLNGKSSRETDVKKFVKDLNIAVDNLCQCLPQERVVEFVKMNSKDLLINTEKAVGDVSLYKDHMELIEVSNDVKRLEGEKVKLQGKTEEKERQNQREEEEVKRLQERKAVKEEVDHLQLKKPWLQFELARQQFVVAKTACDKMSKQVQKESSLVEPYLLKVEEYLQRAKEAEKAVGEARREVEASEQMSKKIILKTNQCVKKADEMVQEFKRKVSDNSDRQGQIIAMQSKIRDLENELNNKSDETELLSKISRSEGEMSKFTSEIEKMMAQKDNLTSEQRRLENELKKAESRLRNLDVFQLRRNKLAEFNAQASRGMDVWQEMKANFNAQAYPPMLMVIDVLNPVNAKFVEGCIPKRDLFAFVFEDKDDLQKFSHELSLKKIKCALIIAPAPPNRTNHSIDGLRKYGFHSFTSQLFTAPDAVMNFLCAQHHLDMIPVGNESSSRHGDKCSAMGFKTFFTDSSKYTMNKSRYDGSDVETSQPLQNPKFLTVYADTTSIDSMKQKILDLNASLEENSEDSETVSSQLKSREEAKVKIREECKVHKSELQEVTRLKSTIELRRKELKTKQVNVFDEAEEKALLGTKIVAESQKLADLVNQLVKQEELTSKNVQRRHLSSSLHLSLKSQHTLVKKRSDLVTVRLKNLEEALAVREGERNVLKIKAKDLRNRAVQDATNKGHKLNNGEIPKALRVVFNQLPETLEQLEARLEVLFLKLNSMIGVESDSAVEDFENRKREIAENKEKLHKLSAELERRLTEMATVKDRWLQPLKELMRRIDENFSHAMKGMGYAGDVLLRGDGNEFSQYGIVIRVKYRDHEELQELSAYHQSGGERSVATVIYMMALQELTKVPFRCIDEVNQGMDATNERKIFDLIVQTAMKNSSQYFLLSPKLLQGLKYSDKMQIHCIQNGTSIPNDFTENL